MLSLFGSLARERRFVTELVRRDIRARYAGARFGLLWSVVNPAIQLVSYSLIFGFFYSRSSEQETSRLVAVLFCGLWPWWSFQEGTMRGLSALVDQGDLLRRIPLPPEACVCASVTAAALLQTVGFLLFLVVFGAIGLIDVRLTWAALPVVMVVSLALTMGLALLLAPFYAAMRDTAHVVTAALTIGFFVSPVLYDMQELPPAVRLLAVLNPMATIIELYRMLVLGMPAPSGVSLGILLGLTGAFWAGASVLFARTRSRLDEYW